MNVLDVLRRARAYPLRQTLRLARDVAHRRVTTVLLRRQDRRHSTYATSYTPAAPLHRYFSLPSPEALHAYAEPIAALTDQALAHRFDLLGSGPVPLHHGTRCHGVEGRRYDMSRAVAPDADGCWLEGRLNAVNLGTARQHWRLVEAPYAPIDWQLDFKSGYRWRESSWYLDVAYGGVPGADVKVPWELSRMQHLPLLAWAHVLAGQDAPGFHPPNVYARAFRNQVLDFIAQNPPRFGVNWRSSMEVGLRVASWLTAYDLFRAAGATFDEAFETAFAVSIYHHGDHVLHNLEWNERYRGNHYLANVVGLLFAAAYLPASPEVDAWLAFAVQELIGETQWQFHPDGTNFEGATCYHGLAAEMALYGTALVLGLPEEKKTALTTYDARRHRVRPALRPAPLPLYPLPGHDALPSPFPQTHFERLERAALFVRDLTRPDGRMPQFGDNDNGRFLKLFPAAAPMAAEDAVRCFADFPPLPPETTYWRDEVLDHRHLAAAAAGLFGRADLAAAAGAVQVEAEVLRGLCGPACPEARYADEEAGRQAELPADEAAWGQLCDAFAAAPVHQRRHTVFSLPESMGAVRRCAYPDFGVFVFRGPACYLAVRCGPIGQHGTGGHDHNDQLTLELVVDGEVLLHDPGTYLYTPLPAARNRYRSVKSHNAPQVEGREPAGLDAGLFRLAGATPGVCRYFGPHGFAGQHRSGDATVWRLVRFTDDSLEVCDWLEGPTHLRLGTPAPPPYSPGYGLREAGA